MTWALRISGGGRTGTGVALSRRLVLTCEHVVRGMHAVGVRDEFGTQLPCNVLDRDEALDVALLEPAGVDDEFEADSVLVPRALWRGARPSDEGVEVEVCSDEADTPRALRVELRPAPRSARRVQFGVRDLRQGVQHGYSGGPVVEADWTTTPRLLGIVRARDVSSTDALDKAGAGWLVPTERIAERFEAVAALVETPVERSAAWQLHWEPRSRGVVHTRDPGFFFAGRDAAYATLRGHMEDGEGLLVVAGRPGSGKSAVIAHLVALSCPRYLTLLGPAREEAVGSLAPLGHPVDAAVWARAKTPTEIAGELAEQLGFKAAGAEDLLAVLQQVTDRLSIAIDAVEESHDPAMLMRELVVPAAQSGAAVALGASAAAVMYMAPGDTTLVGLDDETSVGAIEKFVARRLTRKGGYDANSAEKVAAAVSAKADRLFVVAEVIATTLAAEAPIDVRKSGWRTRLPADLTDAFRGYLARFGDEQPRVLAVLHPLAHALGAGLRISPDGAWLTAANRMRADELDPLEEADLRHVSQLASDYLLTSPDGERRLYHDGLAEAVRKLVAQTRANKMLGATAAEQEEAGTAQFTDALVSLLPEDRDAPGSAYTALDDYLLQYLPAHLAEAGRTAELFRPGLLLVTHQDRLRRALIRGAIAVSASLEPARVALVDALARNEPTRPGRAAAFCLSLRRQGEEAWADRIEAALVGDDQSRDRVSGDVVTATSDKQPGLTQPAFPYELISAPPLPWVLATITDAHSNGVTALAAVEHGGEPLIISAGWNQAGCDQAIHSWRLDGRVGQLNLRQAKLGSICALEHDGEPLIILGGSDGSLSSWRPDGGTGPLQVPHAHVDENGHGRPIRALAVAAYTGEPLIVSAGEDRALRSWRLDGSTGPLQKPDAHSRKIATAIANADDGFVTSVAISALTVVEQHDEPLIISAGYDDVLRSWRLDGRPGPLQQPSAYRRSIQALAVVEHAGAPLVVAGGVDNVLRTWKLDGREGPLKRPGAHSLTIHALAVVEYNGEPLIVSGGGDGAVRSWRLDGSAGPVDQPYAHPSAVSALVSVEQDGQTVIVSGGDDRALRSWRLDRPVGRLAQPDAYARSIKALAVVEHDREPLIIGAGQGTALRSWRLDGRLGPLQRPDAETFQIASLAVVQHDDETLIISGGTQERRSWTLDGREGPLQQQRGYTALDDALAVIEHDDEPLIISDSGPGPGLSSWRLDGRAGPFQQPDSGAMYALAALDHEGEPLIVGACNDWTLRSWRLDGRAGPLQQSEARDYYIERLAVVEHHDDEPLIVCAGRNGALLSWRLDGRVGPLQRLDAHNGLIRALAIVDRDGEPLIVSAGDDRAVRSWWLDGRVGPLQQPKAHANSITSLAIAEHDGEQRIISADLDAVIIVHAAFHAT
jgi:WD40 repeat protein